MKINKKQKRSIAYNGYVYDTLLTLILNRIINFKN